MANYNIERLNFLVVDDNEHMRALLRSILHALGTKTIHEASNGEEAFEEFKIFPVDIIICDWEMSPIDGIEFARLVRTDEESPNPFVPIIMLTGHTELSKVTESRDAGINEFLAKPISATSLYFRIRSLIEHPREFVKTKTYFGPDRQRKQLPWKGDDRRKPS